MICAQPTGWALDGQFVPVNASTSHHCTFFTLDTLKAFLLKVVVVMMAWMR
jgi:hypothetical protein